MTGSVTGAEDPPSFRLAYVPGVTPAKWVRIWRERLPAVPLDLVPVPAADAADILRDGGADAGFLRLPADRTDLSAIPLYTETTVVVVPKDHLVTAAEEVTAGDLADEIVLRPLDDTLVWEALPGQPAKERPATTADAIELVAAGVGLLVVPQSLARLHHRRDLTYRAVTDAPQSRVALSWREDATTDLVEQFIGIVRGRTVNSTRGRPAPAPAKDQRAGGKGGTRRTPAAGKQAGKPARKAVGKTAGKAVGKTAGKAVGKTAGKAVGKSAGKNPRGASGGARGGKRGRPRRRS